MLTYFKLFSQSADSSRNPDDDDVDGETPFEENEGKIQSELQLFSMKKEDSPQLKDMVTQQHYMKNSSSQYNRYHNNFNTLKSITDLIQQAMQLSILN